MAKVVQTASLVVEESDDLQSLFDIAGVMLKNKVLNKGTRAMGNVILKTARQRVPVGDPAHNPGATSLKKSLGLVIRQYGGGLLQYAIVGPVKRGPGGQDGAHGYNVEFGHDVFRRGGAGESNRGKNLKPLSGASRSKAKPYLAPAADTTQPQQLEAAIKAIQKFFKQEGI